MPSKEKAPNSAETAIEEARTRVRQELELLGTLPTPEIAARLERLIVLERALEHINERTGEEALRAAGVALAGLALGGSMTVAAADEKSFVPSLLIFSGTAGVSLAGVALVRVREAIAKAKIAREAGSI